MEGWRGSSDKWDNTLSSALQCWSIWLIRQINSNTSQPGRTSHMRFIQWWVTCWFSQGQGYQSYFSDSIVDQLPKIKEKQIAIGSVLPHCTLHQETRRSEREDIANKTTQSIWSDLDCAGLPTLAGSTLRPLDQRIYSIRESWWANWMIWLVRSKDNQGLQLRPEFSGVNGLRGANGWSRLHWWDSTPHCMAAETVLFKNRWFPRAREGNLITTKFTLV